MVLNRKKKDMEDGDMYMEERHHEILKCLSEKGLLKRTHGGAIPVRQIAAGRPDKMTVREISCVKKIIWKSPKKLSV